LQGKVEGAFGKLERDDTGAISGWHPLVDHMIDVAACFLQLANCRSIRRAMERAAGHPLSQRDIARLAVLAFLHDLGKANSGFQAKRWPSQQQIQREWPPWAGHGSEAMRLFDADSHLDGLLAHLPVEPISTWGEGIFTLLHAALSHHGRPLPDPSGDWNRAIWEPVSRTYDPTATLQAIGYLATTGFPDAFTADPKPLPDSDAFGHFFAGLIQLADWLGSSKRFFPFSAIGEDRLASAPKLAQEAIAAIGLDAEPWRSRIERTAPEFATLFEVPAPRPIQAAMDDAALGPLVILESETGSGKTEAALWRFLHLFRRGLVDSLYFALPTRVAASQAYERIHRCIGRLWPEAPPLVVRALPGYTGADGAEAKRLPDFDVQWSDNPDDLTAQRRWAAESPKRFLAAPVAVGTIDQALLGILPVKHAHLRLATLARSLLVVDEVHASDAYMGRLLERLLKAQLGNGGHTLLLSATLGSSARRRYLAIAAGRLSSPLDYEDAATVPYPAISEQGVEVTGRSKEVHWRTLNALDDPAEIARLAIEAAAKGAKVLVIRNTVPAAVATFRALEEAIPDPAWLFSVNGVPTLHHSRFSRQDRPVMDRAIEAQLGKGRPLGPLIVVGTQTLEQSLDLDADLLISDLCPMDVLLQRIGRLHRHDTQRPEAHQGAQAWILTPLDGDLGPLLTRSRHGLGMFHNGGGVYPDLRIVEATRRLIGEHPQVELPRENRRLVEAATHPERLHVIETELGPAWQALGGRIEGQAGAQQSFAHLQALDLDRPFGEQLFPQDEKIATRLGAQDRLLHFDPARSGPFGEGVRELPLRYHLVPESLPPDAEPTEIEQGVGEITFRLGETRFRYSRLGLERLRDE
jgi:CRISPR-associated endonuclease/helicase Cas3